MKLIKFSLYLFLVITVAVMFAHIIQFISMINNPNFKILDIGASPKAWFVTQFCTRTLFLAVGFFILRLIQQYEKTGFYTSKSLRLFDYIALACVGMAILEAGLFSYNIYLGLQSTYISLQNTIPTEVDQYGILLMTSIRFIFKLFIGDSPQTMYFIMALVVLAIKEFVKKALVVHLENQAFI